VRRPERYLVFVIRVVQTVDALVVHLVYLCFESRNLSWSLLLSCDLPSYAMRDSHPGLFAEEVKWDYLRIDYCDSERVKVDVKTSNVIGPYSCNWTEERETECSK
jgi:hypothetical protein